MRAEWRLSLLAPLLLEEPSPAALTFATACIEMQASAGMSRKKMLAC